MVFVEAEFDDDVYVTVQLKDTDGADTTAGADGMSPAKFTLVRSRNTGHPTRIDRWPNSHDYGLADANKGVTIKGPRMTGADGSFTMSLRMADPETGTSGTEGSVAFAIFADTNAPGATGNLNTTPAIVGMVHYTEPGATTTTTTTSTTTTTTTTTTTPTDPPAKPTGLSATAGSGSVDLSWDDPGDASIAGYQYRQRTDSTQWADFAWADISGSDATTTSHTVSGLTAGTEYRFQIRAKNGAGESLVSNTARATPS